MFILQLAFGYLLDIFNIIKFSLLYVITNNVNFQQMKPNNSVPEAGSLKTYKVRFQLLALEKVS